MKGIEFKAVYPHGWPFDEKRLSIYASIDSPVFKRQIQHNLMYNAIDLLVFIQPSKSEEFINPIITITPEFEYLTWHYQKENLNQCWLEFEPPITQDIVITILGSKAR